jgi:nitrite reductase/ring-hydroxylating ferredoxin subunit
MTQRSSLREWPVAGLQDIAEPGALEFKVGAGDWPFRGFVVRWQGHVYAYENSCAHAGHPLNMRPDGFFSADQSLLICGSHGALFEPETGVCIGGPCVGASLRALDCRVDGGEILVRAPASMRAAD